jgi:hypothetical protein
MKSIRIGCASAFWGDTNSAAAQLLHKGRVDYLVFDYLAEITMSILAARRSKDENAGYATDFVEHVMAPLLPEIKQRGVRVIANAGGVNPLACKRALEALAQRAGLRFRIAVVLGDDLLPRRAEFAAHTEMDSGAALPDALVSMNAYLGAVPIAQALSAGADIVITGRCVDSALALGPLMYEFGWGATEYDKLAAGSVAGHIIECGTQCTGGNFTDWQQVRADFADMGFPIVECDAEGDVVVTKPDGTGGRVNVHTVLEQLLYEIGDPRAYVLPDVVVDFTPVRLEEIDDNRVRVRGARGGPPTEQYKVSATYFAGLRCVALFMIGGIDAAQKGRASAAAVVEKVQRQLRAAGLGDFTAVDIHCIGAEESYGPHARPGAQATREVAVRLAVQHDDARALKLFSREIAQAATAMAPGFTGYLGAGRPDVHQIPRLFSTLLPKERVPVEVVIDEARQPVPIRTQGGFTAPSDPDTLDDRTSCAIPIEEMRDVVQVPLIRVALARSGDKGNHANIGVIARRAEYVPYIRCALTAEAVRRHFAHVLFGGEAGRVERFELPGTLSWNFVLYNALGGGGASSLRTDPQGKAFAQLLLDLPIAMPRSVVKAGDQ